MIALLVATLRLYNSTGVHFEHRVNTGARINLFFFYRFTDSVNTMENQEAFPQFIVPRAVVRHRTFMVCRPLFTTCARYGQHTRHLLLSSGSETHEECAPKHTGASYESTGEMTRIAATLADAVSHLKNT